MDGVLIESTRVTWTCIGEILARREIKVNINNVKNMIGSSLRDILKNYERTSEQEIDFEEFREELNKMQLAIFKKHKTNINLVKLLEEIKENNIPLGIGSSSTKQRVLDLTEMFDIQKYFSIIIGAEDVKSHKPNPELFLETAKQLNVAPSNCIVFEDAINGIEAAKNAGMKCVALLTPFFSKEDLKDADLIIEDFSEITVDKLEKLFNNSLS